MMQIFNFDFVTPSLLLAFTAILSPILGKYIALVFSTKMHPAVKVGSFGFAYLEKATFKLFDAETEMTWQKYLLILLVFSFFSWVVLIGIMLFQNYLPFNPNNIGGVRLDVAFSVASAFLTNTDWQSYRPEVTLSHFSQMAGLALQNFFSPAIGICGLVVLIRGLSSKNMTTIGNFWADFLRSIFYILLPLSIIFAIFLVSQGVPQNFEGHIIAKTLEGEEQVLAQGPAASQIAIKQLGSNGGGFFSTNSAHPYENPTYYSNLAELLAIILLPCSLIFAFGYLIKDIKQAMVLLTVCVVFLLISTVATFYAEYNLLEKFGLDLMHNGKETRIGYVGSVLWNSLSSLAGSGSSNSNLEAYAPLAFGIILLNMLNGGIIFGGVGNGLYGLIIYALVATFIAALMAGRIPEYLGKKLEIKELKLALLTVLVPPFLIIGGCSFVLYFNWFSSEASLREISRNLYAFTSNAIGNGIGLEGFKHSSFSNWTLGVISVVGRFMVLIPAVAIGGILAARKRYVKGYGSLTTDNLVFIIILFSFILGLGIITFFPLITMGPILEHLILLQ